MKLTPWFLAALAPIAAAGCSGTLFGHVAVLAVTLGIFIGTLSLGRGAAVSSPLPAQTTGERVIEAGESTSLPIATLDIATADDAA